MEINDIVTSLELSKELDELGVKGEPIFYWIKCFDEPEPSVVDIPAHSVPSKDEVDIIVPAWTTDELMARLPDKIMKDCDLEIGKIVDVYYVSYYWQRECYYQNNCEYLSNAKKLPDALAKVLIDLIKAGEVKA